MRASAPRAIAFAVVVLAAVSARAEPAELAAVGQPKPPAYIYTDELAELEPMRFRKPRAMQVARPGRAAAIRIQPGVRYLWVIDKDGSIRVAPESRNARGVETSGHPLLTGGGPARLGGVMVMRGRVLTVDSDSGRYGYLDPSMSKSSLEAAARWMNKVAITDRAGRRLRLETRYVPSIHDRRERGPLDRADLRLARYVQRHGGYVLLPPRDGTHSDLPTRLRTSSQRLGWSKRARQRWQRRGTRTRHQRQRPAVKRRARSSR
ncbi:MAG: hypothetical protein KJO07_05840 [Deltaproteobacteria bacterium]|nr:hypothetical protein [Deltaproteobacteria bacterium]